MKLLANKAERGTLPAVPTICAGQPTALDPSRAPEGKAILWLQLPEEMRPAHRRSYSPPDLEALNVNLVGGDPYGGYCGIDQFFLWRPLKGSINHRTHVPGLYHIGASTHPGPDLGSGSGFLLGSALK